MKQIKAFLGLFVVVAGFYVAFKLMPPFYNQMQFQDSVEAEARNQSYAQKSEDEIKKIVFQHAQEDSIPITQDQIQVQRAGTEVSISVDYVVHVDLIVMPIDLKFHAGSKNRAM
jgi:hypothetical protein